MNKQEKELAEVFLKREDTIRPSDKVTMYVSGDVLTSKIEHQWRLLLMWLSVEFGIRNIEGCRSLGELQDRLPKALDITVSITKQ